jgi:hypothetical protein
MEFASQVIPTSVRSEVGTSTMPGLIGIFGWSARYMTFRCDFISAQAYAGR